MASTTTSGDSESRPPHAIDTAFLSRCINALEMGQQQIQQTESDAEIMADLLRAGVVKEFEIILEQSGKLLRKCLLPYLHSKSAVDKLTFGDVYRHAGHHGILQKDEVARWLQYRENRNSTSHDYGAQFVEATLALPAQFIIDARALVAALAKQNAAE